MTQKIKNTLIALSIITPFLFASPVFAATDPCANADSAAALKTCLKTDPIIVDIQDVVNILSALVGIAVVGSLIYGGIQYASAGSNPDGVAKAKKRITDAVIAFVAFLFIFALVQWLIPGGVFS